MSLPPPLQSLRGAKNTLFFDYQANEVKILVWLGPALIKLLTGFLVEIKQLLAPMD